MTKIEYLQSLPIERLALLFVERYTWTDVFGEELDCYYSPSGKKYDSREDATEDAVKWLKEEYKDGDFLGLV